MATLKKLENDIREIKATQERILAIVEEALYPTTSSDFERKQLIAQHGGDVLAALKEHNRRQKGNRGLYSRETMRRVPTKYKQNDKAQIQMLS